MRYATPGECVTPHTDTRRHDIRRCCCNAGGAIVDVGARRHTAGEAAVMAVETRRRVVTPGVAVVRRDEPARRHDSTEIR